MPVPRDSWSPADEAILDEARAKLDRRATVSAVVGIAGLLATVVSFAATGGASGVVFFGAIIAGPLLALDARKKRDRLAKLTPGTPLNQGTLGIATSADPAHKNNRTAVIVLGALIVLLLGFVVLALLFG